MTEKERVIGEIVADSHSPHFKAVANAAARRAWDAAIELAAQEAQNHRSSKGKFSWICHEITERIRALKGQQGEKVRG